jgi:hypothetical protein
MPKTWKPLTGLNELEEGAQQLRRRPRAGGGASAIKSGAPRCALCGSPIYHEFYRVNMKQACAKCGVAARSGGMQESASAFRDGVLYGGFVAALVMFLYAGFTIVTHLYLGYLAVGIGWLVGKGMMKGSKDVGGPRYQIWAVILTYFSISLAAVLIRVANFAAAGDMSWGKELFSLVLWGVLSPILYLQYPLFGFIGLVLLLVGMRTAWRITAERSLIVEGPHALVGA